MGTQKQFSGTAPLAKLTAAITGTPTNFTVDNASGFPTGSGSIPFVVVIDRGTTNEEKILCSAESGNVFTIQTRGWDGTSAINHTINAPVEHCIDADTMNDIEGHIYSLTRDDHTQYAKTDGSRAFTGLATFNAGISVTGANTETGNLTASGSITASSITATGLPGAIAGGRFVGATISGFPTTGTFSLGDYGVDQTGNVWICTAAGVAGSGAAFKFPTAPFTPLLVANVTGPASLTTFTTQANVCTVSGSVVSGQKYLINVWMSGIQSGSTSNVCWGNLTTDDGLMNYRCLLGTMPAVGDEFGGGSARVYTPNTSRNTVFTLTAFSQGGWQMGPAACEITVTRIV